MNSVFSQRLKELREEAGLSQKKLSENTNVSAASIGYYENGDREPGLDIAMEFAKFFGVSLDYMAGLEDYRVRKDMSKAVQMAKEMRENVVFTPTVFGGGDTVIVTKEVWLMIADAVEGKI